MKPDKRNLKFFVMCKSTLAFYETVAGFDCKPAALAYMNMCATANPRYLYAIVRG